ncbi:MAG: hypothetical protein AAF617_13295 [Bacteroidota bacterium]
MNRLLYKLTLVAFLLPIVALANTGNGKIKGKHTKEKTISKEFAVNADALLKVTSSYGTVHMTAWDKNTVSIEVVIKTNGNSEKKVAERLSQIDVNFTNAPDMVNAKTKFNNGRKAWWKGNKVNVTVNYTIKFPAGNVLDISNDYGKIFLDRAENKTSLSSDYGSMEIGDLLSEDNSLNFDYSNNVTIAFMGGGSINADYSSFNINAAGDIDLNADNTKSIFGKVNDIEYTCDYQTLQIGEVNGDIDGGGDYLSLRLGKVSGDVDLEADYGSIKIAEMTSSAGNISIESEFAGIKIGYQSNYYFNFELNLENAAFKGEDGLVINKKIIESDESYYEGYHGKSDDANDISISAEYGSIRFNKL